MKQLIHNDWWDVLKDEFNKDYYQQLHDFLKKEYATHTIYPDMYHIFAAFELTPFSKVKVVILGQDPYHEPGQACGLSFAVRPGVKVPPSLQNIYKELFDDLKIPPVNHGYLKSWGEQGVLLLNRVKAHLEENKLAKSFVTDDEDEQAWLAGYNLLTAKPVIFAANVSEDDLVDDGASNSGVQAVREYAAQEGCEVFVVCAEIEEEISQLDDDEKKMFLDDLGLEESGLEKLIRASYHLLGLISYLTAGEPEVRAWTITRGTKAPQAAGKIHSDFERGFIRAEVVSYDDLMACGSHAAAKEKGLVRLEGKDYVVKDGDIMLFRFNV